MIGLTRTTHPPSGFTGNERIEKNLKLVRLRDAKQKPDPGIWGSAKEDLKKESRGKCAYCESSTSTVAYGDVEHFRPKSSYWWLAYCYDNFLYSCQLCNQKYKRAKFRIANDGRRWQAPMIPCRSDASALREYARLMTPDPLDRKTGGLPIDEFLQEARKERPFLVDPYVEDPEGLYRWEADPYLKEVRVAARTDHVRVTRAMAAAEEDLGLNREELRRRRWHTYKRLETFKDIIERRPADHLVKTKAAEGIRAMMDAGSEYAGMVRYFVRMEWGLNVRAE